MKLKRTITSNFMKCSKCTQKLSDSFVELVIVKILAFVPKFSVARLNLNVKIVFRNHTSQIFYKFQQVFLLHQRIIEAPTLHNGKLIR